MKLMIAVAMIVGLTVAYLPAGPVVGHLPPVTGSAS
jgi:hypothetical protein